jgi:hypothetical protein
MYATQITLLFPNNDHDEFYVADTIGNQILNTDCENIYNEFKSSIESNNILNLVQESIVGNFGRCFVEENFFSNTLEQVQVFQQSLGVQKFIQVFRDNNVEVTVSTVENVDFDNITDLKVGFNTTNVTPLIGNVPYIMWEVEFPLPT